MDRREKRVQDYAGSATAFRQDDLDKTGVTSVKNLASATPYVEIGQQENNMEVYIRGIGSNNNTELGDPATATHIDGVYIPRPRGVGAMFFDLERVEINRGPQGTIRGRNATAGSLNIVTAKPQLKEWDANASVGLGNYSQREVRGMLNIPIGDRLALRLAASGETHSPFYKNAGPVKWLQGSESADTLAYRAALLWSPIDQLRINIKHDYMQEGGTGSTGSNVNGALTAGFLPEEIPDVRKVVYRTPQGREDSKHWGITGDIGVDLGPVNIGYVGSYRYLDYNQTNSGQAGVDFPGRTDYDVDNAGTTYWHQTSKSVTQELRIYSPDTSRFRWSVGGFFFNEEQKTHFATTNDKSNGFFGVEFTMPKMHSRSYAAFADGTFDILKELRVTAGVRGTSEEKSRDGIGNVYSFGGISDTQRFGTDGFAYADQGRTLYSLTPAATMAPFDAFRNGIARFGQRDTLSAALAQPGVSFTGSANEQHGSYDDKFFDFRVGVDGNLTKNNLLYALFSTGHKSGGFNDNIKFASGASVAATYKPEVVYAVEVGSKNELLNKLLIANASAFYYSYQDLQLQQVTAIADPGDPTRTPPAVAVRSNAAQSRVMGLEAEATGRLPAGFTLRLSGLLMDARFTDGVIADTRLGFDASTQPPVSLKDKFLPRAPVLSVNYGIGQNIQTSIGYFDWVINFQTKSKYYMTPFNGEGIDSTGAVNPNTSDVVKGFTRFDVGAGFTHVSGKVRFEGFVNNVTDQTYMTSLINTPGLNLRFYNPPRQMGLRLTVFM